MVQKSGKLSRTFQASWFTDFKWLTVCITNKTVFCFYCRKCCSINRNLTKKYESAFTTKGFNSWRKAKERFLQHEKSELHREAVYKISTAEGTPAVHVQLDNHISQQQKCRRNMFIKEVATLRTLLRQGLAVRGHSENEGNLYQILKLLGEDCPDMNMWLRNQNYLSHDIINELIASMCHAVLRQMLSEVRKAEWFTLMSDETRDISNVEQATVVIRWVDDLFDVNEDFIGLVSVDDTTGETLTNALKDVLIRCMLPISNCRGQSYDGAANMMGKFKGVASQILKDNPAAIPIHCFAHRLNLCLQSVSRQNTLLRDALDVSGEISQLINFSPKRSALFNKIKEELSPEAPGLRPLCPTRWTVRTESFNSILENYSSLQETFNQVNEMCADDYGRRAGGLSANMEKFRTYIGMKVAHLLFSGLEHISYIFQKKDVNIKEAQEAVKMANTYLESLRNDATFHQIYEKCVEESSHLTNPPCLPRYKRVPKKLDEGADGYRFSSVENYFRSLYFEAIDLLSGEMATRFDCSKLEIPLKINELLIAAANGNDWQISASIKELYAADINFDRLQLQLAMLPSLLESCKMESENFRTITEILSISTIVDMLKSMKTSKVLFSEVHKIVKLFLTMPVSSATAERSFSSLRRIKTYLRSTMTQKRLNHVMILHIHKSFTDNISIDSIVRDFISVNKQRQAFFGNF